MAAGSVDAVVGALNVLINVTEKSGYLRNDLRKDIFRAVSSLRKVFSNFLCNVEDKKTDSHSGNESFGDQHHAQTLGVLLRSGQENNISRIFSQLEAQQLSQKEEALLRRCDGQSR